MKSHSVRQSTGFKVWKIWNKGHPSWHLETLLLLQTRIIMPESLHLRAWHTLSTKGVHSCLWSSNMMMPLYYVFAVLSDNMYRHVHDGLLGSHAHCMNTHNCHKVHLARYYGTSIWVCTIDDRYLQHRSKLYLPSREEHLELQYLNKLSMLIRCE